MQKKQKWESPLFLVWCYKVVETRISKCLKPKIDPIAIRLNFFPVVISLNPAAAIPPIYKYFDAATILLSSKTIKRLSDAVTVNFFFTSHDNIKPNLPVSELT